MILLHLKRICKFTPTSIVLKKEDGIEGGGLWKVSRLFKGSPEGYDDLGVAVCLMF